MPNDNEIRAAVVREHFIRWRVTSDETDIPPYVILDSIKVEVANYGDVFVTCDVVRSDGSIIRNTQEHYPLPLVENLIDPDKIRLLESKLGFEAGFCEQYNHFLDVSPYDEARISELLTQRCRDCLGIIKLHGTARWRYQQHTIRCDPCANGLIAKGLSRYEAYYVE